MSGYDLVSKMKCFNVGDTVLFVPEFLANPNDNTFKNREKITV